METGAPSRLEEVSVPLDDGTLNVARSRLDRPPLVLLHGVTRCWQSFLPILPALSLRWDIHAPDLPGHGRSTRTPEQYLVADYVRKMVAFLRRHVGPPAVVFGHSLGAMVAAGVAAEAPDLVAGVVLEDPPFDTMGARYPRTRLVSYFAAMHALAGSTKPLAELAGEVGKLPFVDPETGETSLLEQFRDPAALRFQAHCLSRLDPDVLAPVVARRWLEGYPWREVVGRIRCPALVLQADPAAGGMLTDDDVAHVCAHVADCTRVQLRGAEHSLHWARTQEVILLVSQFLETLDL